MGKVTWRDPLPGETCFGGKGILVPYRPRHDGGTSAPERTNITEPTISKGQQDDFGPEPGESTKPGDQR
jgi:hypothetical protein